MAGIARSATPNNNRRMNRLSLFALFLASLLSACAASDPAPSGGPLTPMPGEYSVREPDDGVLNKAVTEYLAHSGSPSSTRYDFTRIDLDGDNRRDALVMMKGPHHYWCDMNGCSMVIFHANDDSFSTVSEMFPVRGPLYVSDQKTQGWRDLIVRVSGQSYAKAKNVAVSYDGSGYPRNPFFLPETRVSHLAQAQRIFP